MLINILSGITPQWIKRLVPIGVKNRLTGQRLMETLPSYNYLQNLMLSYQTKDLINEDPKYFRRRIDEFLQFQDYKMEGFKDAAKQRDLSIKFHWGHNHDFGEFSLEGLLEDRHISILAAFIDRFKIIPRSLDGLRVLDIGCWTGGTSLLLCAMGAHVVAIEEVKKYVDCLNYLKHAFNIDKLEPKHISLYECTTLDFQNSFDIVLFAGVLYHVTDPILALRITFNCLKDGGVCLLETAAIHSNKRILSYEGPTIFGEDRNKDLGRTGWEWFIPSPITLSQMMSDVGYTDVVIKVMGRTFALGRRHTHVDMMRGGLSVRTVR